MFAETFYNGYTFKIYKTKKYWLTIFNIKLTFWFCR